MTPLFKKLNFKDQKTVYIFNHPVKFEKELDAIKYFSEIKTLNGRTKGDRIYFDFY